MNNPFIYIILNGELGMSVGKAAAQSAHAMAALSGYRSIAELTDEVKRTVIVLEAKNQQQIDNLESYLDELDIQCRSYIDEGVNEVEAYSVTALAIGPIAADDTETREIFRAFPLYGKDKKKKKWWQR